MEDIEERRRNPKTLNIRHTHMFRPRTIYILKSHVSQLQNIHSHTSALFISKPLPLLQLFTSPIYIMSSRKPSSSSKPSSSHPKKKSSSSKSKPLPIPISIPRGSRGGRGGGGGSSHGHVPLSQSFTRDEITRSVGRPESFYPKVGDDESVNTINGDFKFIPPNCTV